MAQVPPIDPPTVHDAPTTTPGLVGIRPAAEHELVRASRVALRVGAVFVGALVLLPGVGVALLLVYLASREMLIEHRVTTDDRVSLVALAVLTVGVAVACEGVVLRSLRQGWIALSVVGLGGIACLYICVRGVIEASGHDDTIVALSVGVGVMGVVLTLGAALGMAGHLRAHRLRPG